VELMLAGGLAAVAAALLLLTLAVLPAGPGRVPLARLDPSYAPPSSSALSGAGAAAGAAVEKALVKRGRLASGAAALERAGMSASLPDVVLVVGLLTLGVGALVTILGGLLFGLLAAVAVPLAARAFVKLKTSRRQNAFADQLDDSLQLMASSLRAGHSILRAMDSVAHEASTPTSEEFTRLVNETRVGRDLGEALDEIAERTASEDFAWVAQAIAIQREVGGNLAEVLDAVGHTIRERNAIRRQVKALSAEGKLSAIVLMGLPFGIIGFISMTNPDYLAGFTESALGYGMLAVAAVMMTMGGFWLKNTVKIRF
jgi:tight adherence protein B